jgi:hypothetical protein
MVSRLCVCVMYDDGDGWYGIFSVYAPCLWCICSIGDVAGLPVGCLCTCHMSQSRGCM